MSSPYDVSQDSLGGGVFGGSSWGMSLGGEPRKCCVVKGYSDAPQPLVHNNGM